MNSTFNDIVTTVRRMSLTEKMEIKHIVERSIIQEQREDIHAFWKRRKSLIKMN